MEGWRKTKRAAANPWDYVPTNRKDKRFNDRGANSLKVGYPTRQGSQRVR